MTKADLIDIVAERTKLPRGRAELLVGQMFDCMVDALQKGEGIEIRGFGSFSIRSYREYQGRNPRTGEAVHVTPKTVHRMTAIDDCDVLEASTPELTDVVRLEDRYGREGT